MSNYKDTYELYQSTFDEVHASDELIQRIKNRNTKHIKKKRFKPISTVAACLAAVMIITVIIGAFSGKGNSFVLKANAAEIGGESFVEIAKVAPVSGESGSVIEGDKRTQIYNCVIPFAIMCDGRNIKSIKYTVENAVFLFPYTSYLSGYREKHPNEAIASDKITEKTESNNKIESYIEKDKQYSSYTVSFDDQINTEFKNYDEMQSFPIQLLTRISSDGNISEEARNAYEDIFSMSPKTETEKGKSLSDEEYINEFMNDIKIIYNEMYNKVTVTADVSFEDGSSDTATLRFSCINADQQNGIIIGARIDSLK